MIEKLVALVVRHGSTELNESDCFRSWVDIPLSDKGFQQAEAAAIFLKDYPIKVCVSSPLLRAFQTAQICISGRKVQFVQDRGLFPWRLGIFSGLPKDENQDALRLFVQNPEVAIPGGESLEEFEGRQFMFWRGALEAARTIMGLTLFVCHTSNVTSMVNWTEGAPGAEPEFGDSVKPGGVGAIYWNGQHHRVEPIFGGTEEAVFGGS